MKAALIASLGGPDVVSVGATSSAAVLQPDQVQVQIEAASANQLDVKIVAGYMQEVFPIAFP